MGFQVRVCGAVLALAALFAPDANAEDDSQNRTVTLPVIDVGSSRLGEGIVGASTTVITAEEIARSPAQSLPDILAQQTGVQVLHLLGSPLGVNDSVDLRGFGAFAQSNVLILVNGRRYQDFDLQGFDFASIPLQSIERVEITRGNSGSVLYGDGAVGGVINIVTKRTAAPGVGGRVEAAAGSYGFAEGRMSATAAQGPWSLSVFGNTATTRGYRQNSELRQDNVVSNLNYKAAGFSSYLNVALDRQRQNLPGQLPNRPLFYPITLDDPRASVFPRDWGHKQDFNITGGGTATVWPGAEFTLDGGVRRKFQQSQFYDYFPAPFFVYDPATGGSQNYLNTGMTTSSLTPRLDIAHSLFGVPGKLLTGVDVYHTQYGSDRYQFPGGQPIHQYDIRQTTTALYGMNKTAILPNVDVSVGGRLQRNVVKATDDYNAAADPNAFFYASNPQAPPLDSSEWQYAAHAGVDYRVTSAFAVFARIARAFRLPNADERVAGGNPFGLLQPANFALKTQTSHDIEGGFRIDWRGFHFQSSVYRMDLTNEIHFIPANNYNLNLDPTRRQGWENTVSYRLTDDVRLRAGAAYTRATFREGAFTGKDVPLVSRWSGNAGVSWDIVKKLAVLDVTARMWSSRYMDNDQANVQPKIPANGTIDIRLGGEYERLFWSAAVQNLFDVNYFDYAIASATTPGYFAAFPQPGRIFVVRAGATF